MVDHLVQLWSFQPQQWSSPILTPVGPLPFGSITLTDELSRPGRLDCEVAVDRLPAGAHQQLRDPFQQPCEATLDRIGPDGMRRRVFTGPVTAPGIKGGETVKIAAVGLLGYLDWMAVDGHTGGYSFDDEDQHQIVKALVDGWQLLGWGHMGIDTSTVADGGKTRTVAYPTTELHNVLDRVTDLAERRDGFDVHVAPDSRALLLWTPQRGTDRSDQVHFDGRNIASADEQRSVAPGEAATSVHAVSSAAGADDALTSTVVDTAGMEVFGRRAYGVSARNVDAQGILDDEAQQALDDRASMHFVPGPGLNLAVGADWADFAVGDTVDYRFNAGLGETHVQRRVARRTLTVGSDGNESMKVEWV